MTEENFNRFIRTLAPWQKLKFREYLLRELCLTPEMRMRARSGPAECPRCASTRGFIRKGLARGKQRFACKRCGLKFAEDSSQLMSYSHLPPEAWIMQLDDMMDQTPAKASSINLHVSLTTVYYMRHKILDFVEKLVPGFRSELSASCSLAVRESSTIAVTQEAS